MLGLSCHSATCPAEGDEQSVDEALTLATIHPCLPRAELVEDIEDFLERDRIDAEVRIKVGEDDGAPWFSITVPGAPATSRIFDDLPRECVEARRVVALSIALAVDALAPARAHGTSSWPSAEILAYGTLGSSFPDKVALGGGLSARFAHLGPFVPSLGGFAVTAAGQHLGSAPSLRYDATLVAGRLEGCGMIPVGDRVALALCAGPVAGAFTTSPSGVPDAHSVTTLWLGAVAAFELHVTLARSLFVHLGVDGLLSLRRNVVQAQNREGDPAVLQEFPRVQALVRAGPGFSF